LWQLERHFYLEEKIMMTARGVNEELKGHCDRIISEHEQMIYKAKLIDLSSKDEIRDLIKILNEHQQFEDNFLYPMLDVKLPRPILAQIIERIK